MVNGLFYLALGLIYLAKNAMRLADWILVPFPWDETDRAAALSKVRSTRLDFEGFSQWT